MIYLVAATGGLEEPTYKAFTNLPDALNLFSEWEGDLIGNPGDRIEVLQIDGEAVTRLKVVEYEE